MNIDDIFARGLHQLTHEQLIQLSNSQHVLLNDVSVTNLVYLIQELLSRVEDLADHRASQIMGRTVANETLHGTEYNG